MKLFRKVFRIREINSLVAPLVIEQRHTVLFFIHFWSSPEFEPPHRFVNSQLAIKTIKEHHPNAIIYDYFSDDNYSCKI